MTNQCIISFSLYSSFKNFMIYLYSMKGSQKRYAHEANTCSLSLFLFCLFTFSCQNDLLARGRQPHVPKGSLHSCITISETWARRVPSYILSPIPTEIKCNFTLWETRVEGKIFLTSTYFIIYLRSGITLSELWAAEYFCRYYLLLYTEMKCNIERWWTRVEGETFQNSTYFTKYIHLYVSGYTYSCQHISFLLTIFNLLQVVLQNFGCFESSVLFPC